MKKMVILGAAGRDFHKFRELEETINRTRCNLVLVAILVDLARLVRLNKPSLPVGYEIVERSKPGFTKILADFTARHKSSRKARIA